MQTLGFLVDQLGIVNLKMWNAQEDLYTIRRMTLEEFKDKYGQEEELEKLYIILKKACDLNVQRAEIVDEIDEFVVDLADGIQNGNLNKDRLIQRKHKSY